MSTTKEFELLSEKNNVCGVDISPLRESTKLHRELDELLLKLGPMEKQTAEFEAVRAELEETTVTSLTLHLAITTAVLNKYCMNICFIFSRPFQNISVDGIFSPLKCDLIYIFAWLFSSFVNSSCQFVSV